MSASLTDLDRREHARLRIDGGEVRGQFSSQAEFIAFVMSDISEGGMRVHLDVGLKQGSRFHFRIDIGDIPKPFQGMSEVQWCQRNPKSGLFDVGIKFLNLTPNSKQLVELILDMQGAERRAHPRIEIDGGEVRGEFVSLADFLEFFALNISEGGMKISADSEIPKGSTFHFRMVLGKGDQPFEGMASVQWAKPNPLTGMVTHGARFLSLTPASKELVKVIAAAHKRLGYDSKSQSSSGLTGLL